MPQKLDGTALESADDMTVLGTDIVRDETTTTLGAEDRAAGTLVGVGAKLTGVTGRGRSITTVPVWPTEVGTAAVLGTAAVMPVVYDVIVVKGLGICTSTVPVWPTAVGLVIVEVMTAVASLAGFRDVTVTNGGGICTITVPV
jgi:hypothetical protein